MNKKRIPLIISVKLINKNDQFAIAFSYYLSKSALFYTNFFSILNSEIFINSILPLKVVLINDSTSIRLAITNSALPFSIIY